MSSRIVWRFRVVTPGDGADDAGGLLFQHAGSDAASAQPRRFAAANSRASRFWALMAPEEAAPERLPQLHCDVAECCAAAAPQLLAELRALTFANSGEAETEEEEDTADEADHWDAAFVCACLCCDDDSARESGVMCAAPGCRHAQQEGPAKLKRCAGCAGGAVYCSKEHQAADWARHKPECKRWARWRKVTGSG